MEAPRPGEEMGHSVHWEVLGLVPETRETSSTSSCSLRPVKPGTGLPIYSSFVLAQISSIIFPLKLRANVLMGFQVCLPHPGQQQSKLRG